ncbi:hypothetical protein [Chlorobium sp. N1]|uniref:hypothetical protein n=1 Tax=Chlorobium sp. N1 TaxID=2491138 RepID=UPI00103C87DD|nr:hypothetical protein [Chlorobium sp. N1]TCD48092.1 hypothetical protein E0L29_04175 [Chlorobium sp. N1]
MKKNFRHILIGMALVSSLGPKPLVAITTDSAADVFASGAYATSIKNEALLASSAENPSENPSLPSASFATADGTVNGSVGSESSSISYRGDESWLSAELGLGYYNPAWGEDRIRYHLGMATMVTDNFAVGLLGDHDSYKRDMVLNTVWQTPLDGFRLKLSGGYMWGKQDYTFSDGVHSQDLKQFSWVAAGEYIVPEGDSALGLHSLGMSAWGSRASDESGDEYQLSEGRLFGVSADTQVALLSNLVAKGSVGYEELDFPLADAQKEKNTDLYTDLVVTWEPVKALRLDAEWKNGVSEDRYSIGAASGPVKLSSWYSRGHAELADEKGVTLAFMQLIGPTNSHVPSYNLADRLKQVRSETYQHYLHDVMTEPATIPMEFLARSPHSTVVHPAEVTLVTANATFEVIAAFSNWVDLDLTGGDYFIEDPKGDVDVYIDNEPLPVLAAANVESTRKLRLKLPSGTDCHTVSNMQIKFSAPLPTNDNKTGIDIINATPQVK